MTQSQALSNGADVFEFVSADGSDTVIGFENNIDKLDLTGFGFTDTNQTLATATNHGSDVRFDFSDDDFLFVQNMTLAQFTDDLIL